MKSKVLLLSATELEHGRLSINGIPIFITGVGKISAAHNTTELIREYKPDLVINFGSCGNLKYHKVGQLLRIGKVHNDIDAEPFAKYGDTPFSEWSTITFDDSEHSCFSTDYFYDSSENKYSENYLKMIKSCDVIDMELYSIAQVCKSMGVPLQSFKWVSDDGSSKDWNRNAKMGYDSFEKYISDNL